MDFVAVVENESDLNAAEIQTMLNAIDCHRGRLGLECLATPTIPPEDPIQQRADINADIKSLLFHSLMAGLLDYVGQAASAECRAEHEATYHEFME